MQCIVEAMDVIERKKYKVIGTLDKDAWRQCLSRFPDELQDVYFMPEYYELYETQAIKAECFVFEEGENLLLYPYLKSDIASAVDFPVGGNYYDIEGAYGYNGLITNTRSNVFFGQFDCIFTEYCISNNIIAEFTRFNPILNNHLFVRHLTIESENKNIVVDLTKTKEEIWMNSYAHAVRKNVHKANRSGLTIKLFKGSEINNEWLDKFIEIYFLTMDRNKAGTFYYFQRSYFSHICKLLGDKSIFIFALLENRPISCELILSGRVNAYSFLGGTLPEFFHLRPNNLLKHEAIMLLRDLGVLNYCLGGGNRLGDTIFRYKSTFARDGQRDFYIGKRIYNKEVYDRLCANWEESFPDKAEKYKDYLLKYKQ